MDQFGKLSPDDPFGIEWWCFFNNIFFNFNPYNSRYRAHRERERELMRRSVKSLEPDWMTETELIKRRSVMNEEMCGWRNETAAAQLGIVCMTRCSTGSGKFIESLCWKCFNPSHRCWMSEQKKTLSLRWNLWNVLCEVSVAQPCHVSSKKPKYLQTRERMSGASWSWAWPGSSHRQTFPGIREKLEIRIEWTWFCLGQGSLYLWIGIPTWRSGQGKLYNILDSSIKLMASY